MIEIRRPQHKTAAWYTKHPMLGDSKLECDVEPTRMQTSPSVSMTRTRNL